MIRSETNRCSPRILIGWNRGKLLVVARPETGASNKRSYAMNLPLGKAFLSAVHDVIGEPIDVSDRLPTSPHSAKTPQ